MDNKINFFFSSIRCMLARNERKFQHVKKDNAKLEYYQIRYKSFGEKRHYTMIYYILVFVVSFWLLLRLDIYFFDFVLFTCLLMESLGSQSIYESCFFVVVFFFFLLHSPQMKNHVEVAYFGRLLSNINYLTKCLLVFGGTHME